MAKRPRRRAAPLRGRRVRIGRRIRSWRQSYSTPKMNHFNSRQSGRRSRLASRQNLNVREVQKKEGEIFEYEVFISQERTWSVLDKLNIELTNWLKSCLSSQYKIYRIRSKKLAAIKSIKLESESDLMMFMLCHREHVRKIFKMVDEPVKGSSTINS